MAYSGDQAFRETVENQKQVVISENTTGDQEIVAAVTGKRIVVTSFWFKCSAANTLTWKSATTAISGAAAWEQSGGMIAPFNIGGYFWTIAGQALNLNLSAAQQVSGSLTYIERD